MNYRFACLPAMVIWVLLAAAKPACAYDFAFGADLSFVKESEDNGTVFKDGTNALPGLQIFHNHGYNWIRLRIFVEPVSNSLPNNLAYTIAEARDAKKLGYKFLLDFHYANSWADPGKQPTPGAWQDLSHRERVKQVFEYSRDTIAAFRDAGHGANWKRSYRRHALARWEIAWPLEKFCRLHSRGHQGC
jgi:arabinogalactan endo-1,4-beta-galactosidase